MINDEALYFHETYLLSELIKTGTWIGNYAVGLHGFLFKLPPALVFLITGPSVTVVTIYHILLTAIAGTLAYKFFTELFKSKSYSILTTLILLTNFHFFISTHTYLREIPTMLIILLLLSNILKKKSKWILSLLFLLLLDVKEYVFIVFALFYIIWLFIDSKEKNFLKRVWFVVKQSFVIFLPSIIWIVLMFTTSVIPVNMFLSSIIGLNDDTFSYLFGHFQTSTSTLNSLEGGRNIPLITINELWNPILIAICSIINTLLSYLGKVLYPRVFSFLSVPKVVILPVVISSFITLKRYLISKKRNLKKYAILSLLILVWLLIYILRASHGRYLLPIVPAIAIIYIYMLFNQRISQKQKKYILIFTFIYITAGLFFETTYILPKAILEYFLFGLFTLVLLKQNVKIFKYILVVSLSIFSMGTAILFSYVQGQIYGYIHFGENRNAYEIAQLLPEDEKYWINSEKNTELISVFNSERYLNPEWKWKLNDIVPIRDSLKVLDTKKSYSFPVENMEKFRNNLNTYEISKIVLIVTKEELEVYPEQEKLNEFLQQDWLELEDKVEYRGMEVYFFNVKE
jgi:hypothetical protein